ncbi:collagen alpha-1(III) chain-like [Pyrgilauda ruficollis]|uniref:collagen alpha-1(III) chain-like n=1 Tax=Pyrgilauda ruficollis TaxID=221976 RepID=UPI001B85DDD1|nr:collagen alpha-1(III) chain-like [Pyrgilauda ruficollis]
MGHLCHACAVSEHAHTAGIEGRGESGSFLSLTPGPRSPAAGRGARSPPGRAPRWRPGGAGGSGTGRGGAEESGGTETGPGGQGTAVGRYPAGSGGPGSAAPPVLLAGSGAPGGSGTIGRLRCPVAAAHPGGSGVSAPGTGEGGSGRSQKIPRTSPWTIQAPLFPGGHRGSTSPGCPIPAPRLGGPGGLQCAATADPQRLPCPGAPSRRWPRGSGPSRSHQREPKGRGWWRGWWPGWWPGWWRGRPGTPQPGRRGGTATPPSGSQTPPELLPAATQPACVSLREPPLPGGCTPCQSSPPAQACAGNLKLDRSENSGCGSKEGVPRARIIALTSGFPPGQAIARHHVQTESTVKHLCSDHFVVGVVSLN